MKLTTKAQYEMVITDVDSTLTSLHTLEASIDLTDLILDGQITVAENALLAIISSAQEKLDLIEQEEVMDNFLAELKVVFDKYTAKIELGSTETGYGLNYGEGETAVGIKLTATFEGTTATKEINKSVIVSGDLV
jgi:hypothetical protein